LEARDRRRLVRAECVPLLVEGNHVRKLLPALILAIFARTQAGLYFQRAFVETSPADTVEGVRRTPANAGTEAANPLVRNGFARAPARADCLAPFMRAHVPWWQGTRVNAEPDHRFAAGRGHRIPRDGDQPRVTL